MAIIKGIGELLVLGGVKLARWLSGPSKVMLDTTVVNHISSVTAGSIHGFEVTIQCQATYFRREYQRWWRPSKRMAVYSVSATVPADAPVRLKDTADDFMVNIPRECSVFTREVDRKQRAVEAYVDLLLAKMDRRDMGRKWW